MDKGNDLAASVLFREITSGFAWLCLILVCFVFCAQNHESNITLAFFKICRGNVGSINYCLGASTVTRVVPILITSAYFKIRDNTFQKHMANKAFMIKLTISNINA